MDTYLLEDAARVLERLIPIHREVHDQEGRWYLTSVRPYRSAEDRIEGVVITFVDITSRKQAEEALRELNETLEDRVNERTVQVRELAATLTLAEQEERRRISQLLHDDLQQLLYGIQMKLAHAREVGARGDLDTLMASVDRSMELLDDAIARTRHLTVDLNPPVLEGEGLIEALEWIRTQMHDLYALEVEVVADGPVAVEPREMRVLLFQAVRELLFNVAKHADTHRALVEVSEQNGTVTIQVTDEGAGFRVGALEGRQQPSAGGWGLFSVRERLRLQGGDVEIRSRPGKGTRVILQAPESTPSRSNIRQRTSDR